MRGYHPDYDSVSARSLVDALTLLAQSPADSQGRFIPLAGGTDLMVLMAMGKLPPGRYLDLYSVSELRGISSTPSHVDIRALTTYTEVRYHSLLQAEFPGVVQAAAESGAVAIQNRGTIGGNIANGSPAADTPPALLAYDAEIELVSLRGTRWLPYADFHTDYKKTLRADDELIARVRLPRLSAEVRGRARHYYRKVGTRRAQAISKVCLAGFALHDGDRLVQPRLALGSVAPVPLRCRRTEEVLAAGPLTAARIREAQEMLGREIRPIDDVRSTAAYRLRVAQNLIVDFARVMLRG
jgi:CO/xanthine dehydrogenase FAD-binding subunit